MIEGVDFGFLDLFFQTKSEVPRYQGTLAHGSRLAVSYQAPDSEMIRSHPCKVLQATTVNKEAQKYPVTAPKSINYSMTSLR